MALDPPHRIFLALLPGPRLRGALSAYVHGWRWPADAVIYAPDDWHLTLHFLGSVPSCRLPELRAALQVAADPFVLTLGQPTLWPRGLAVMLPTQAPTSLRQLHTLLKSRLHELGLPTEARSYTPHLTLARKAEGALPPAAWPEWRWHVRSYALMESTTDRNCRYRLLQRYSLLQP